MLEFVGAAAINAVVNSEQFQSALGKTGEWAADRAFGMLDGFTPDMAAALGTRLASLGNDTSLPVNHDIERAVTRATLLATLHCLAGLNAEARAAIADDPSLAGPARTWRATIMGWLGRTPASTALGTKPPPFPSKNFTHAHAAMRWYFGCARRLRHDTGKEADREHLIEEASLGVGVNRLERAGARQFAANNVPDAEEAGNEEHSPETPGASGLVKTEIETAVINQVVDQGGWPEDRHDGVRSALEEALFGAKGRWWLAYSLYYAEELNSDDAFRQKMEALRGERLSHDVGTVAQTMKALVAGSAVQFEAVHSAISTNHEEQMAALASIMKQFRLSSNDVFFDPKRNMDEKDNRSVQSFYFAEEEDEFIGREDAIRAVESRLLRCGPKEPGFAWTAITGGAGSGKSRLALHLCDRNRDCWPFSGFVQAQMLRHFTPDSLKSGMITEPTLFVLDYAGGNPTKCAEFLARCAAIAEDCPAPIRALVLVRQTKDRFFDESREAGDGSPIVRTREDFEDLPKSAGLRIDPESRALELQPLSDDELVELMHNRMLRTHRQLRGDEPDSPPPRKDREALLKLLHDYDPHRKRALIALLLADAHQRGTLGSADDEDTQEKRLKRLLQDHLQWQFDARWRKADGYWRDLSEDQKDRIDRHLSLLILATCCRVFTDRTWEKLLEQQSMRKGVDGLLPLMESERSTDTARNFFVLRRDLLQALSGQSFEAAPDRPYPIFEPDLFGEALLLMVLGEKGKKVSMMPGHAIQRQTNLVDLAWAAMPQGMAGFIALLEHDFPKTLKELGWCLPTEVNERNRSDVAEIFRFLVRVRLDAFFEDPPQKEDFEEIDRLLQMAPCDLEDPDSLSFIMKMRSEVAGDLAAMINNNNPKKREMEGISSEFGKEGDTPRQSGQARQTSFVGAQLAKISVTRSRGDILLPETQSDWDACRALLRSLSVGFEQFLFNKLPLDIREDYLEALGYMVTSILWNDRADAQKGGRDKTPLSEDEIKLRNHIAETAEKKLAEDGVSDDDAGLASQLLSRIIYAEWGSNLNRGDSARAALARIATGEQEVHPVTARNLISAATNVHYLVASVEEEHSDEEAAKREAIGRSLIEDSRKLMQRLDREPTLEDRRGIILNYANLLSRQSVNWDRTGWPDDAHDMLRDYSNFLAAWPGVRSDQKALVFLSHLLRDEKLADRLDRIDNSMIEPLVENGFDPEKHQADDWNNLGYILYSLSLAGDEHWAMLQPLLKRILDDHGKPARIKLRDTLRTAISDTKRDGVRSLGLLEAIMERTDKPWSDRKLSDPILAAAGRALLDGHEAPVWRLFDRIAADVRRAPEDGGQEVVFELGQLIFKWRKPDDPAPVDVEDDVFSALEGVLSSEKEDGTNAFALSRGWHDLFGSSEQTDRLIARSTDALGAMLMRGDEAGAWEYLRDIEREGTGNDNRLAQAAYLRGLELAIRWHGQESSQAASFVTSAREALAGADAGAALEREIVALSAALKPEPSSPAPENPSAQDQGDTQ